jgi:RNase P/RNase MRP subunit p29
MMEIESTTRNVVVLKTRIVDESKRMVFINLGFENFMLNRNTCFQIKCTAGYRIVTQGM